MAEQKLNVFLDGIPVGTLTPNNAGRVGFSYHEAYNQPTAIPLSLSLPLGRSNHPSKAVNAFIAGLLPDSELTLQRWGRQFAVSPRNPFALLTHVGADAAGAVQVLPDDVSSSDAAVQRGDVEWLSDDDVCEVMRELAAHPADWNPAATPVGGAWLVPRARLHFSAATTDAGASRMTRRRRHKPSLYIPA